MKKIFSLSLLHVQYHLFFYTSGLGRRSFIRSDAYDADFFTAVELVTGETDTFSGFTDEVPDEVPFCRTIKMWPHWKVCTGSRGVVRGVGIGVVLEEVGAETVAEDETDFLEG